MINDKVSKDFAELFTCCLDNAWQLKNLYKIVRKSARLIMKTNILKKYKVMTPPLPQLCSIFSYVQVPFSTQTWSRRNNNQRFIRSNSAQKRYKYLISTTFPCSGKRSLILCFSSHFICCDSFNETLPQCYLQLEIVQLWRALCTITFHVNRNVFNEHEHEQSLNPENAKTNTSKFWTMLKKQTYATVS